MRKSAGFDVKFHCGLGSTYTATSAETIALPAPNAILATGFSYFLAVILENTPLTTPNVMSAMAIRNDGDSADLATFTDITMPAFTADADSVIILSLDKYLAAGCAASGVLRFLFTASYQADSYAAFIFGTPRNKPVGVVDGDGCTYYLEEA